MSGRLWKNLSLWHEVFCRSTEAVAVLPILAGFFFGGGGREGRGFHQGLICLMEKGHLVALNSPLVPGRMGTVTILIFP